MQLVAIHWLLEIDMFGERETLLGQTAVAHGHQFSKWRDSWWDDGRFPCRSDDKVIFHGSLGNAARMAQDTRWHPGAFCNVDAFKCSTWYEAARPWMLNQEVVFTTVRNLVDEPTLVFPESERLFVRPDSPLKPFSGRVLDRGQLSLNNLDHGYYYDDHDLPIVVSPALKVGREYRFVVAGGRPITGSGYHPDGRQPLSLVELGSEWSYARKLASVLPSPEAIYVMDICECEDGFRLLELNPFSGADLYNSSAVAIVEAIAALLEGSE